MDRRTQNETKIVGLRRSMTVPATMLALDVLTAVSSRPHGARLGIAVAVGTLSLIWLIASWRSIAFTTRHLNNSEDFWNEHDRRAERLTVTVGLALVAASLVAEVVALRNAAWFFTTALLGPLTAAAFALAGVTQFRARRRAPD